MHRRIKLYAEENIFYFNNYAVNLPTGLTSLTCSIYGTANSTG